jgi:hypothetical protein
MNQALDFERQLYIAAPIETLARPTLVRLKLGKLRFPEAQNVGFHVADLSHIANFEVEAIGDGRGLEDRFAGKLRGHFSPRGGISCLAWTPL